jgi:myo-inositol-1(or 4)-monophosphatase
MYEFIPAIMREAAKLMLSAHDVEGAVTVKPGDANFVTAYDMAVEDYLFRELGERLPEAVIIGEEAEENHTELLRTRLALLIDPIDGTTNFIHNYRYSSISVGVCDRGTMVWGGVLNPYSGLLYHAEVGRGAYAESPDGRETPIRVSPRPLSSALAGFGTSPYYREELGGKTFRAVYSLFRAARDVRRSGSAALDLAMVAAGSLDVFLEYRLSPWDIAAGSLLVTEAGGVITQTDGSPLTFERPCSVLAANPACHAAAMGMV